MNMKSIPLSIALLCSIVACSKAPDQIETHARERLAAGEPRSAVIELKNLLKADPNRPTARALLADASAQLGEYADAEFNAREARKLGASLDETALSLARSMAAQGEDAALLADTDFEKVADSATRARVMVVRAGALSRLKGAAEAEKELLAARDLAPKISEPRTALAALWIQTGKLAEAEKELGDSLAFADRSPEVHTTFGLLRNAQGRPADAAASFAKAADLASRRPADRGLMIQALSYQVLADLTAKRVPNAVKAADRLEALGGSRAAYIARGRVELARGNVEAARAALEKAAGGTAVDLEASLLLGFVHLQLGNLEQAENYAKQVAVAVPEGSPARRLLAAVRLRQKRPDDALSELDPLIDAGDGAAATLAAALSYSSGGAAAAIAVLDRASTNADVTAPTTLELVSGLLAANQLAKARALYDRLAPAVTGSDSGDRVRLALLVREGDRKAAAGFIEDLARRKSNNVAAQLLVAEYSVANGDASRARIALDRVNELAPNDPAVALRAGELALASGNLAEASKGAERVLASQPDSEGARRLQVRTAVAARDWARVLTATESSLATSPGDASMASARVLALRESGRADDAIVVADAALARSPESLPLQLLKVEALAGAGKNELALAAAEKVSQAHPRSIEALTAQARLALAVRGVAAASSAIDAIRKVRADHPAANMLEAEIALRDRNFAAAADAYRRARLTAPSTSLVVREFQARKAGRLPNADAVLDEWLARSPGDVVALLTRADARLAGGDQKGALADYRKVVDLQPDSVVALNNGAWLLAQSQDLGGALAYASKAHSLAPNAREVADTYGWVLTLKGDAAKAIVVLEGARPGEAPLPALEYHYALALSRAGRKAEALTVLEKALGAHPAFAERPEAEQLLASLR